MRTSGLGTPTVLSRHWLATRSRRRRPPPARLCPAHFPPPAQSPPACARYEARPGHFHHKHPSGPDTEEQWHLRACCQQLDVSPVWSETESERGGHMGANSELVGLVRFKEVLIFEERLKQNAER